MSPPRPEPGRERPAARIARLEPPRPLALPLRLPEPPTQPATVAAELWLAVHLPGFEGAAPDALARLAGLAEEANRFAPRVSLVPPDGLVLEVKGSLHLFGGVAGLMEATAAWQRQAGREFRQALAPTALAALAAARCGRSLAITEPARLAGELGRLPLAALRLDPHELQRFAALGIRTLGEVLRLPRAGLARRFGPQLVLLLDRLTGRTAHLLAIHAPVERFRRRRDLGFELADQERLIEALGPLLEALGQFLTRRQCGITQLECRLRHRQAAPTRCVLRLAEATGDVERIRELLAERLRQVSLREPVRDCELRSGGLEPLIGASRALWQPGEHGGAGTGEQAGLIERLRARLGEEGVHGLTLAASHRPESAWARREPRIAEARGSRDVLPRMPPRPAWLLVEPQPLDEREGRPWRQGPVRLLEGPERIETGWWDGQEIGRDYYAAVDAHGVRLWLFRERLAPHRWYLHGVGA